MVKGKIGVFDSGFGGLTVLSAIRNKLPGYDYLYLGDSARAPYGTRSFEVIYKFTEEAVDYLFNQDCELIILACNTASAEALRKIQQEFLTKKWPAKRVLGVVIPTAEYVAEEGDKNVGVIATNATVESESYSKEISKRSLKANIFQKSCPLLVPIIETGELNPKVLDDVLNDYLIFFNDKNIDSLILGCTHYEIIKKEIEKAIGSVKVIGQSEIVAEKLADYLKRHTEIESKLSKKGKIEYQSTDLSSYFEKFAEKIVGKKIKVSKVTL